MNRQMDRCTDGRMDEQYRSISILWLKAYYVALQSFILAGQSDAWMDGRIVSFGAGIIKVMTHQLQSMVKLWTGIIWKSLTYNVRVGKFSDQDGKCRQLFLFQFLLSIFDFKDNVNFLCSLTSDKNYISHNYYQFLNNFGSCHSRISNLGQCTFQCYQNNMGLPNTEI